MAALLRPDNAGSNTASDHIITSPLAAFSTGFPAGRWLSYSVGMTITDAIHQAVLRIPKRARTPACDSVGIERPGAWSQGSPPGVRFAFGTALVSSPGRTGRGNEISRP